MGLRAKLVALFFVGFGLMAGLGIAVVAHDLEAGFAGMAQQEALRLSDQLVRNFRAELEHLDELDTDWAHWAGMYEFADTLEPAFADSEIGQGALASARLSVVTLFDNGHRRRFQRVATGAASGPPAALQAVLDEAQQRMAAGGPAHGCGLGGHGAETYLLCWQPVHLSDGSGPARGTLLMGRLLGPHILQRIRNQSALDFEIGTLAPGGPPGAPADTITADRLSLDGADHHVLAGRILDTTGRPAFGFRIRLPADIERSGQQLTLEVVAAVLLGAVLSGLTLVLGVQVLLVRPLGGMERQLRRAGHEGGWPAQIDPPRGRDEIASLAHTINDLLKVLGEQGKALEQMTLTDPLTRLANRRAFDLRLASDLGQSQRSGSPLSLLILDVDHFKRYNDLYGHPAGDAVLAAIGRILQATTARPADLAARLGGEEFALLLPSTTLEGAAHVADRIHAALAALGMPHAASPVSDRVTISIGATQAAAETAAEFVARADRAAYIAKNAGRNRTQVLGAPQPAPAQAELHRAP